eukprot:2870665-Prymnesium_polylepis.3
MTDAIDLKDILQLISKTPSDHPLSKKLTAAATSILSSSQRVAAAAARRAEAEMRLAEGRSPRPRQNGRTDPPSRD